ncbi:MAG TPA: hypothetical protein VH575_31930 [Gemmataceae bacterium]|jgi:hypothetical protein
MNCLASHDLLQQDLDGTPIESPEWLEHLRGCPDCRALAAAARRLHKGLGLLVTPLPPPDLAARIAERVLLDRRRARRRARRRWAVSLALAAGLFVALALRLDWRGRSAGHESDQSESIVKNETPAPPAAEAPTLRESAAELGGAVASLTSQTADETMEQTSWLVPKVTGPVLPKVDLASIEPPTRPLREVGEGVSAGLEPVTNSARRAVDLFLRELPPMETEPKGL